MAGFKTRLFKQGRCTIKIFDEDDPLHAVIWGVNGRGRSGHVERLASGTASRRSEAIKNARKAAIRSGCGGKRGPRAGRRR